jgi:hypothetical protein
MKKPLFWTAFSSCQQLQSFSNVRMKLNGTIGKRTTYDQKDENQANHNQFIPIDWRALEECSILGTRLFPLLRE